MRCSGCGKRLSKKTKRGSIARKLSPKTIARAIGANKILCSKCTKKLLNS